MVLLTMRSANVVEVISSIVFATSIIALYTSSTIYHGAKDPVIRQRMRTVDHAMIYVLIAGTYTPFTLLVMPGTSGWILFAIVWSMAAAGIAIKLFYTGHYDHLSTIMYVVMGWLIVFAIKPLIQAIPVAGFVWLFAGGIAYTVGAIFYSIKKMPFGHATFHIFCLVGSLCHIVAVYFFVLS